MYIVGSTYTRNDIYSALSLPENQQGGDWLNGYHRHDSDYYIFCNVGIPGRGAASVAVTKCHKLKSIDVYTFQVFIFGKRNIDIIAKS